jgi:glucose-1-phosphate cytidylyltransferase
MFLTVRRLCCRCALHAAHEPRIACLAEVPTIVLCGGRGSRLGPLTTNVPKPMLQIGGRPVLWHVMKIYATYGYTDFVLALGWLGEVIREFVLNLANLTTDFSVELAHDGPTIKYLGRQPEVGWRIDCVDTGLDALTGTRVRRAARYLNADTVMVTYGDGLANVDVGRLVAFHRSHGRLATITAVRPPSRFGELCIDGERVTGFEEKPQTSAGAINGGFMVLAREAIDRYIPDDRDVMLEREPLGRLVADDQLRAWVHDGFWQPMDTPRERDLLVELWDSGTAPWKVWG